MNNAFIREDSLVQQIRNRIKTAGEHVWQRYPLPWTHPAFRSADIAAHNLMKMFPDASTFLVMRDQCLRPVREQVLVQGKALVIPTRHGDGLLEVPVRALGCRRKGRVPVLRIDPPPPDSRPFSGTVDVIVVSCLAFNRHYRRLYTFELEQTAYLLEQLRDGLPNGWRLPDGVPVVCVASDSQEITDWPQWAQGFVEADLVVTPTRVIALGSGEQVGFGADAKEEEGGKQKSARLEEVTVPQAFEATPADISDHVATVSERAADCVTATVSPRHPVWWTGQFVGVRSCAPPGILGEFARNRAGRIAGIW